MKTDHLICGVSLATALGCALIAGVFFAFSTFVMKALSRLPANAGIAAMQSINVMAVKSWFLGVFLGTAAACVVVGILSLRNWSHPSSQWLLAGSLAYLLGCFVVTMVFNVPRNDALATLGPAEHASATEWARYIVEWTAWNHVRALASLAGATLQIIGLIKG